MVENEKARIKNIFFMRQSLKMQYLFLMYGDNENL